MTVSLGVRIANIFVFTAARSTFKVNSRLRVMRNFVPATTSTPPTPNPEGARTPMGIPRNYGCYDIKRDLFA